MVLIGKYGIESPDEFPKSKFDLRHDPLLGVVRSPMHIN